MPNTSAETDAVLVPVVASPVLAKLAKPSPDKKPRVKAAAKNAAAAAVDWPHPAEPVRAAAPLQAASGKARKAAAKPKAAAQPVPKKAATKTVLKAAPEASPKMSPKAAAAAAKKGAKPVKAANTGKPVPAVADETKPLKVKLVRDSFTIPAAEYAALAVLKQRALAAALPVKKSELLRAGIQLLAALTDAALLKALKDVEPIKTGRPKGRKGD